MCACCGRDVPFLISFYLYRVCEVCGKELKQVAKGEYSEKREVLVFYINAQASFLSKKWCPVPSFVGLFHIEELNALAQWMQELSLISLM